MIQRILHSRGFVSAVLAMGTGVFLYYTHPFPEDHIFLRVIAIRAPHAFLSFKCLYNIILFTTPFMVFSTVLSGLYIFTLKVRRRISPGRLPRYPDPGKRDDLFLVVGEVHNPRKPGPSETPQWLTIPERGLFTGIAIFGAIGTGKTSCCMYPFAEQILAYKAADKEKRIGGLILEVKGDFCHKVNDILDRHQRGEDYIEVSLDSEYRYNPLHNDLDAYALAFSIASLIEQSVWPWQGTILAAGLHEPRQVHHPSSQGRLRLRHALRCLPVRHLATQVSKTRIPEAEEILMGRHYVAIKPEVFGARTADLAGLEFVHDPKADMYLAPATPNSAKRCKAGESASKSRSVLDPAQADPDKLDQLEAVKRWFEDDWKRIEPKLRTSIVEGISVFLSLFDDSPKVKKIFCPKKECYDPAKNVNNIYGKPLPSFSWLIENGKVCALNFPIGLNPGLAKALGVMMKLDFERATLNRIPEIEAHPEQHFRQVLFLCDEYQHFATVGENDPTGDEKFFSLSRQPKCIAIIATQSISSLKSALPGDTWRTLLQTFRTKIFLALSDDFSARSASELCGREDKLKVSYNLSESSHDARVSLITGKAVSQKANITASKSYNTQTDYRFDMKTFTELRNAQSVTIAYDGFNPMPPMFCYLKPYFNDPNKSYFRQVADREL